MATLNFQGGFFFLKYSRAKIVSNQARLILPKNQICFYFYSQKTNKPMNKPRRDFIKKSMIASAGAIVAPTFFHSCKNESVSDKVNVAHIGVGRRGSGLAANFLQRNEHARIVAVCDAFQDRRGKVAGIANRFYADLEGKPDYKGCETYADFGDVLKRDDIDAVVIATCDHWHVHIAMEAAKAGKAIYVEKPLGLTLEWGKQLREVVRKNNIILQYGTQQRSNANFRLASELAVNEAFGKIERVNAWSGSGKGRWADFKTEPIPEGFDYDMWIGPAPMEPYSASRVTPQGSFHIYDYSIGYLGGWGAHPLDIVQWGLGTDNSGPVEYSGVGGFFEEENFYDNINDWDLHCKYENGVDMHFFSVENANKYVDYVDIKDHGTTFLSKDAWVNVGRYGIQASDPDILKHTFTADDKRLYASNDHQLNFLECIKSGKDPICNIDAAVRSDTISHLSDIFIRSGESILKWNPEKEEIVDPAAGVEKMLDRDCRVPWQL